MDTQKCETKIRFKHSDLNFETTAVCFSADAKFIAFATKTHLHIANILEKRVVKSIYIEREYITILAFNISSQYIIAGNIDGRVLLYKYNSSSQLARLCSFPYQRPKGRIKKNFVSSMTFYENLLAVSGYGGAIFIIDIYSGANRRVLLHSTARKGALYFLDEDSIISADNNGTLQLISIEENTLTKSIKLPFARPIQIVAIPKTKYLIIHGNTDIVIIVDSKEFKIIHSNYIEFEDEIDVIEVMDANTLIVCLKNQKILHIDLPSRNRLSSFIVHNSLDKAFDLIEREPMLRDTIEHKSLERIYNKTYINSANALINQNKILAKQMMDIYKNVDSKKESIRLLFRAFENYDRFKTLYFEKKYALAYAMSSKFPALKITKQYESMEFRWREAFTNAQRHILRNKPDFAKAILADYITVGSKRPIIELIIKHNEIFIEFLKALDRKEYKRVHEIALKNPLFTQIPIYKTLEIDIEKSISRIESYIKKNRIDLARENLAKIEGIYGFSQKIEQLYAKCEDMLKLQDLYVQNNFYSCYELIDLFPHLCSSELGELLQNHWIKLMHKCEDYSSKGNIKDIKVTLGELVVLSERTGRIGDLFRVSFQVQIKYLLANKRYRSAQNIIYSYIDIFTKDKEISSLMRKYEFLTNKKLAITQVERDKSSRDSWLESKIIVD